MFQKSGIIVMYYTKREQYYEKFTQKIEFYPPLRAQGFSRGCNNLTKSEKGRAKPAFTLAETLITLVIVGIVAAITVPAVMTNINSKQKEEKLNNVYHKLSESTDKMLGISGMNGYNSTEEFLNAFKNHLAIAKICKPENIKDCWGSKEVTLTDGTKWDISKTTIPKYIKVPTGDDKDFADVMGFVTNDGTPFIISYNRKCDKSLSNGHVWSGHESSSSNCIAGVFDYNGGRKPNKLADDVRPFNGSGGLGPDCAFKINGNCYLSPVVPDFATKSDCEKMIGDTYGITACYYDNDYWAGAVKQCGGVSRMVTKDDLKTIAEAIYGKTMNDTYWTYCNGTDKTTNCFSTSVAENYGITSATYFWSAEESNSYYSCRRYFTGYGSAYDYGIRDGSGARVLCRGD